MADLLKFIRSWQKGAAIALDRPARRGEPEFGKLIYDKACVSCHGPEGRGGVGGQIGNPGFLSKCHGDQGEGSSGPSLNSLGFLKAASNGYLAATIIMGR